MVYIVWYIYDTMDVDDNMVDIIPLTVGRTAQIKVYIMQTICYGVYLW